MGPEWRAYREEINSRKKDSSVSEGSEVSGKDAQSPVEYMEDTVQNFNFEVETELRKRLQSASPEFFEKAVVKLLRAMGYGRLQGEARHVGGSNDGGIDGVISQDALGLTNVYIQAKKYADINRVGEPAIRNFIGSLDALGANLGVFITTSSFLPRAEKTAANYRHGRIVLIDGKALTRHMLDYGVAVQAMEQFTLYEIDEDFFDEEGA